MMLRLAPAALVLLLTVPSCGAAAAKVTLDAQPSAANGPCTPGGAGFALSLTSSGGGAASPEQAAEAFAQHLPPRFDAPRTGWHVTSSDAQGATVRSGSAQLHAITATDQTWLDRQRNALSLRESAPY